VHLVYSICTVAVQRLGGQGCCLGGYTDRMVKTSASLESHCSGFLKSILFLPSNNFLIMCSQASKVRCLIVLHAANAKPEGFCQLHTSNSKIDVSYRNNMEACEICVPELHFILSPENFNLVVVGRLHCCAIAAQSLAGHTIDRPPQFHTQDLQNGIMYS
jgi:hypothetical protein